MNEKNYSLRRTEDGFYSVRPLPTREELREHYNNKYYHNEARRNQYSYAYTEEELEHKYISSMEAEAVAGIDQGSYLDVGCGEGFGLDYFSGRGWDVKGIDFTTEGIEAIFPQLCRFVDATDIYDWLDGIDDHDERYDLITCNNVLEHVLDPLELLRGLRKLLNGDGVLRIAVPNDGSWIQRLVIDRSLAEPDFYVHPPEHLHYFTRDPLVRLAERAGYRVADLLGEFPVDIFLLNPDSNYQLDRGKGRNCHFARVAFERVLAQEGVEGLMAFRRGCAAAGIGRDLIVYLRQS